MQSLTSFDQVNRYLTRYYRNARVEYKLDNMRALMAFVDNPQDKLRVVHVAGTSGKTSTAYYAAALLNKGGAKAGLTVSPHVDAINERLQIGGQSLPEVDFCAAISEYLSIIEDCPVKPSWFEAVVGFVYWYFAKVKVDYAVVEVGLGGLKDGTNVISRADKVCVITDIGYDHVNVLGNTLTEIAQQKLGIVQPGNVVFMHKQAPEVMTVAEQYENLHVIGATNQSRFEGLSDYQWRNWQLAYAVADYINNRDKSLHLTRQVLLDSQKIVVPGRMDIRQVSGKTLIMDGAHNGQKMRAFVDSFQHLYPGVKPAVLISVKHGKEYEEAVEALAPLAARVITTRFADLQDTPATSMAAGDLAEAFRVAGAPNVEQEDNQAEALRKLLAAPEPTVIITGSFYLLSQIRNNEGL